MHINLGVIGPWQVIFLVLVFILIPVFVVLLFVNRAKHKARADVLDEVRRKPTPSSASTTPNPDDKKVALLSKLNKLRENGALTDEEFLTEKRRILSS